MNAMLTLTRNIASVAALAGLGLIVAAAPLAASTAYDGVWTGTSKVAGADAGKGDGAGACLDSAVTVNVVADTLRGAANHDGSYYYVEAKLATDGTVKGFFSDYAFSGKFTGSSFSGTAVAPEGDCTRTITLNRQ